MKNKESKENRRKGELIMNGYAGERTMDLIQVNQYGRRRTEAGAMRQDKSLEWHLAGTVFMIGALWIIFNLTGIAPMQKLDGQIHGGLNLIPFQGIVELVDDGITRGSMNMAIFNIAGNILLFFPLGFLMPMLYGSYRRFWRVSLFGAALSLSIEIWQLFLHRATDVDDLMLNVFGTMIGFVIYAFFEKKAKSFCRRFRRKSVLEPIVLTALMAAAIVGSGFYKMLAAGQLAGL